MVAAKLPKIEIIFCGLVWTLSIIYSAYRVYLAGKLFDYSHVGDDFATGWKGYQKDQSDYEWRVWVPFILYRILPWNAIHIVLGELGRYCMPKIIPGMNVVVTSYFLYIYFGPLCLLFAIVHVMAYYMILRIIFRSVFLVWLFGVPMLVCSCYGLQEIWVYLGITSELFTMMIVSTALVHLRCMSYILDHLSSTSNKAHSTLALYEMLGFSFYFPFYFLGPFMIYSDFRLNMYRSFEKWTLQRVRTFVLNILRYSFWSLIAEGSLYFLYIHTLQFQMPSVVRLGDWTLYGLGYLLCQFFCLKYICVYGLAGTIARFEGYAAPPPPKCVARIHLYTDMWRYFDVGYYRFMHKYIYTPLCGSQRVLPRRLLASAVCFCYVFIWHGLYLSIFIWSLLNYIGVTIVTFANVLSQTTAFKRWERKNLTEAGSRRLKALLAAPMFVMSNTSNMFFFSGYTTGITYVNHLLFNGSWKGVITLLSVSYCMCQFSIEAKNYREAKNKTKAIQHKGKNSSEKIK